LISGPTALDAPPEIERVMVTTAEEMHAAVVSRESWATMIVMNAAVADYRATKPALQKIKKKEERLVLELERTVDIIADLGRRRRPEQILVGFAAETESAIEQARRKVREKSLDLIVANDVSEHDAGFDVDHNRVWLIGASGEVEGWPLLTKDEVGERLVERLGQMRGRPDASEEAKVESG
jgi:phosphopantothenoylcysteine decarboxylase / phosphopantothenate---cysteine ligase